MFIPVVLGLFLIAKMRDSNDKANRIGEKTVLSGTSRKYEVIKTKVINTKLC